MGKQRINFTSALEKLPDWDFTFLQNLPHFRGSFVGTKIARILTNLILFNSRLRDEKHREIFEKTFPELKKAREERERCGRTLQMTAEQLDEVKNCIWRFAFYVPLHVKFRGFFLGIGDLKFVSCSSPSVFSVSLKN